MKTKTTNYIKYWLLIPMLFMSLMLSAQGTILEDICNGQPNTPVLKETIASYPLTDLSDANGNNNTEILPGVSISETNGLCLNNTILENFVDINSAITNPDLLSVLNSFDVTAVEDNFDPENFGVKLEFNLSFSPQTNTDSNDVVVLGVTEDSYLNFLGIVYNVLTEQIGVLLEGGNILYADVDVSLNQWHTIEVKYINGEGFLYLNGELILAVNGNAVDEEAIDISQFDISELTLEGALNLVAQYAALGEGYEFCLRNIEIYKCDTGAIELPSVTVECSVAIEAPTAWDVCGGTVVGTTEDPTEFNMTGDYTVNWTFTSSNGIGVITIPQSITVVGGSDVFWSGAIDSDWTNAGNWLDNNAPTLSPSGNVIIATGAPNYPLLTSGQNLYISACSNVMIESGASLTINPNAVVNNDGTITNNGILTFESDATGSAYIGEGSGIFIGDATIERFIPARRAFRFVSSPVTTDDFISNNWQLATHITGSQSGANGFDATNTGNPSMFTYDNVTQTWGAIANTNATNLNSGDPYRLFVRGDRTTDLSDNDAPPSPTTLMATGELTSENTAPEAVTLNATAGGYSFVGNPFQAQVNMKTIMTSNVTNVNPSFYWLWDPNLGIRGAYATVFLPAPVSIASAGDANEFLQAGQACFVQTLAANPASLTFTQSSKSTSEAETNVFKSSGTSKKLTSTGQMNLKLYESSAYANNQAEADGLWILFDDNGNNGIDTYDAEDFTNLDENFSINSNGTLLSFESRATPTMNDEIILEVNTYRNTDYVIEVNASALQGDTPLLVDNYLNQTTEISQNGITTYEYSIDNGIPDSFAGDRFKIIFQSSLSTEDNELSKIMLYPNPSKGGNFFLNVPNDIDDLEVSIYNTLGAQVFYEKGLSTGNKVPVNANIIRSEGVYFVKLTSKEKGLTTSKKLIIN